MKIKAAAVAFDINNFADDLTNAHFLTTIISISIYFHPLGARVLFKGTHCLLFVALDALVAEPGSACDCLIVLSQLFVFANDT